MFERITVSLLLRDDVWGTDTCKVLSGSSSFSLHVLFQFSLILKVLNLRGRSVQHPPRHPQAGLPCVCEKKHFPLFVGHSLLKLCSSRNRFSWLQIVSL